jgi:3-hydroxybutyryl-CoA dehydrogenase
MRILILGAGLMGAPIGCEFAIHGHEVVLSSRDTVAAGVRFDTALAMFRTYGLVSPDRLAAARDLVSFDAHPDGGGFDRIIESLPEIFDLKVELMSPLVAASPGAVIATNTSSLSVTALGEALGAGDRIIGTHYWNPPTLMPLVEVAPGESTPASVVQGTTELLSSFGKHPVVVRDVRGFVWNRLQVAVLRECVWLLQEHVASAATIETVVTEGLARRWRSIGLFEAIGVGGFETWNRLVENLLPTLSTESTLPDLTGIIPPSDDRDAILALRNRLLAEDLTHDLLTRDPVR